MPTNTTTDSAALNEVRATIEALTALKIPLSESANEGERHARALVKQSEAQKLTRSGLGSLEKSLFSLASGSKDAGQALAGFARNFLGDLLKTTLRASVTRPLENLFSVAHGGGLVGEPTRLRSYHQGGIVGQRADEVPIIAQRGEEILTRGDPRHRANLGAAAPSVVINVSVQPQQGRNETLQEQAHTIARAVQQSALAAIEQQAERGGNFARMLGRRRA